MAVVLVTGMSGVGKSTVLAELARRGHRVVDSDEEGYIESVLLPERPEPEPSWHEDRMTALLDAHADGALFIAGYVANQGSFSPRFNAVVLLSAPEDVLLARIASRTTDDFGKRSDERERIIQDIAATEPLLRAGATLEIDTRLPLEEVANTLIRLGSQHSSSMGHSVPGAFASRASVVSNAVASVSSVKAT